MRFDAYGWHTAAVDGHDPEAIERAIAAARAETGRPSLIACRTVIGKGAPTKAGKAAAHGAPLGAKEIEGARAALGWPHRAVRGARARSWRAWRAAGERGAPARYAAWQERHEAAARRAARGASSGRIAGELPAELAATDRRATSASCRAERPAWATPQGEPGGAGGADRGGPGDGRRLGRPHPLQPHQHQPSTTPITPGELWRPLRQLRRARARAWWRP